MEGGIRERAEVIVVVEKGVGWRLVLMVPEGYEKFCSDVWCIYRPEKWKGMDEMRIQVGFFVCIGGLLEMDIWIIFSGSSLAL